MRPSGRCASAAASIEPHLSLVFVMGKEFLKHIRQQVKEFVDAVHPSLLG
jgi:ABC-type nitrate/sulfonate/bicarbonate transport system substrate-binding protein